MENVTTHACQSRLESFRIQVIPGKVPNWIWLLSNLKQPLLEEIYPKALHGLIQSSLKSMEKLPLPSGWNGAGPLGAQRRAAACGTSGLQLCRPSPASCSALLCSRQQQPPEPGSFPLFCTPISQAVPQTLMPVDTSQSYFNTGNMWRCFASVLLCNAEGSGSVSPHASGLF